MSEFDEFVEALFGQLEVELKEENDIASLAARIAEDPEVGAGFESIESLGDSTYRDMAGRAAEFLGLEKNTDTTIRYLELAELKRLKGQKVFCDAGSRDFVDRLFEAVADKKHDAVVGMIERDPAKYLVYSTYAIQYISKITTTYGDYMDNAIFINKFVLSRYPSIILYKMGKPYGINRISVNAGYRGAVKMTILEETIHSMQEPLYRSNQQAVTQVNGINERLARIILDMDEGSVRNLSEYLQLQAVPDEFPFARRANLFFFLNPDHFLTEQIGPGVMTYTHIEVDPKIAGYMPELASIYKEWLAPIQSHHAAFSIMEGMAEYSVKNMLSDDREFREYLGVFTGKDAYHVRKDMGADFVSYTVEKMGTDAFSTMLRIPPTTAELKNPPAYVRRASAL